MNFKSQMDILEIKTFSKNKRCIQVTALHWLHF